MCQESIKPCHHHRKMVAKMRPDPGWILHYMYMDYIHFSISFQHNHISAGVFNQWPFMGLPLVLYYWVPHSTLSCEPLTSLIQGQLSPRQVVLTTAHVGEHANPPAFQPESNCCSFHSCSNQVGREKGTALGHRITGGITRLTCPCLPPNLFSRDIHQGGYLPCSAAGELQSFPALSLGPHPHHRILSRSLWCLPCWSLHFFLGLSYC